MRGENSVARTIHHGLVGALIVLAAALLIRPLAAEDDCAGVEQHWKSAKILNIIAGYEEHIARFPNCRFAALAKKRIEALQTLKMICCIDPLCLPTIVDLVKSTVTQESMTFGIQEFPAKISAASVEWNWPGAKLQLNRQTLKLIFTPTNGVSEPGFCRAFVMPTDDDDSD